MEHRSTFDFSVVDSMESDSVDLVSEGSVQEINGFDYEVVIPVVSSVSYCYRFSRTTNLEYNFTNCTKMHIPSLRQLLYIFQFICLK